MRKLQLSMILCALLSSAAIMSVGALADESASHVGANAQPSGTVVLDAGSIAAGIGYVWGHGNLTYGDQVHEFGISGVSIVDAGGASITATGDVYYLTKLADFAGNYLGATAGLTIADGGSAAYLTNEHGVVIKPLSTTAGFRFNLATGGVTVKLKS